MWKDTADHLPVGGKILGFVLKTFFLWFSFTPALPTFCFKVLSEHTGQLRSRGF